MNLKKVRIKKVFAGTARLPAAAILLCLWTTIVSAPANNYSFAFPANIAVPDGNINGLAVKANLSGLGGSLASVTVSLDISGGFNGDLYAYLAGPNGGFAVLLNRVGVAGGDAFGYSDTGFRLTFDDSVSYENIHFYQNYSCTLNGGGQLTGIWATDGRVIDPLTNPSVFDTTSPTSSLDSFVGTDPNGTWTLYLADLSGGGQSTLVNWSLNIVAAPEPSAIMLLGIGTGIFLAMRKLIHR